jgi:hypothetical protein
VASSCGLSRVSDNSSRHKKKKMADVVLGCTVGPEALKELSGKEPRKATTHVKHSSFPQARQQDREREWRDRKGNDRRPRLGSDARIKILGRASSKGETQPFSII